MSTFDVVILSFVTNLVSNFVVVWVGFTWNSHMPLVNVGNQPDLEHQLVPI